MNRMWQQRLCAIAATIATEVMVIARQVIIARLFGAETLGQFMIAIIILRCVQMLTDMAADRYLLTRPDHQLQRALATVHGYTLARGLLSALLIYLFLHLWAADIEPHIIAVLALAGVLNGAMHQGYRLEQRQQKYKNLFYVDLLPVAVATAAIWPFTLMFGPLMAIAAALFVQAALEVLLSHLVSAELGYAVKLDAQQVRALISFGAPLLGSSAVLFLSLQGERLIFAQVLSTQQFAIVGSAIQLAMIPALMVGRLTLLIGLPVARLRGGQQSFQLLGQFRLPLVALAGLGVAAFAVVANPLMNLLYGAAFSLPISLLAMIAAIQAGRVLRAPDSVIAQSLGHTRIPLGANIIRALSIGPVAIACAHAASLTLCLVPLLLAEGLAYIVQAGVLGRAVSPNTQPSTAMSFQPKPRELAS